MEGFGHSLCQKTPFGAVLATVAHGLVFPNSLKEEWEEMVLELGFHRFANILRGQWRFLDCVSPFPTAAAPQIFYMLLSSLRVQLLDSKAKLQRQPEDQLLSTHCFSFFNTTSVLVWQDLSIILPCECWQWLLHSLKRIFPFWRLVSRKAAVEGSPSEFSTQGTPESGGQSVASKACSFQPNRKPLKSPQGAFWEELWRWS